MESGWKNNFGLLRLFFASLVIVSHAPILIDGNQSREIVIGGTLNVGEIAVDGFFLVSGYLITQSFAYNASVRDYVVKRVLRIYPAFIIANMILLLVVAPLVGGGTPWTLHDALQDGAKMMMLLPPSRHGAFEGIPLPILDGAMWTIAFEFRCYLMVIALALLGFLKRPLLIAGVAFVLLFGVSLQIIPKYKLGMLYDLSINARLTGVFLVGVFFYLLRNQISYRNDIAAVVSIVLCVLMFFRATAEPAFAVCGGYLVFWLAFFAPLKPVSAKIKDDISYGLYLYAWPITNMLIYYKIIHSPWVMTAATFVAASLCGFVSWHLVEKPFLRLKPKAAPEIYTPENIIIANYKAQPPLH